MQAESATQMVIDDAGQGGLTLRQLECFLAVADTLHFGNAAKRLHLSQPSVSEAVGTLERLLGQPLFNRSTRVVSLTHFGVQFLQGVKPSYDALLAAVNGARRPASRFAPIRLAHTPELGQSILPYLVERVRTDEKASAEELTWLPSTLHTDAQVDAVSDRHVDIGLCWQAGAASKVELTVLAKCPFVAIMREDDPLAASKKVTLDALDGRRTIVSSRLHNKLIDGNLRRAMARAGLLVAAIQDVVDFDDIGVHALATRGIGLHPATIVNLNRMPGLTFRAIADPSLSVDICAVTRANEPDERIHELVRLLTVAATDEVIQTMDILENQPA